MELIFSGGFCIIYDVLDTMNTVKLSDGFSILIYFERIQRISLHISHHKSVGAIQNIEN